jgi:hypothetical protein
LIIAQPRVATSKFVFEPLSIASSAVKSLFVIFSFRRVQIIPDHIDGHWLLSNLQAFYHFRSQDRSVPTVMKAGGPVMFTDRTSPVAR